MTVCIAAIAGEHIVTASDMMICGGTISTDGNTLKQWSLGDDWAVMVAGNDISHAIPIIERARVYLKKSEDTLESVRSCVKRAFQERVLEVTTDRVLSNFDLDMPTFKRDGKKIFNAGTFAILCNEIRAVSLASLQFLVYGFGSDGTPHIFTVCEPCEDAAWDVPGFRAIGSGEYAAESILYFFNQSPKKTFEETIFNVFAAKFMAERAIGVGRDTHWSIRKRGCGSFTWESVPPIELIQIIRSEWEGGGSPQIPPNAIENIKALNIRCHPRFTSAAQLDPQSTIADQLPPQPSPGSSATSGES
jgi:hypothetical protein